MPLQRLPHFIIIGAMKAGTTGLYSLLSSSTQFNLSNIKEPNFFNSPDPFGGTWNMGLNWYESLFENAIGLRGEASTSYTKYPRDRGVFERMASVIPNVKLVYLVRNPIDRTLSHFLHNKVKGTEHADIRDLMRSRKECYCAGSEYEEQIVIALKSFQASQLLVIIAERLWSSQATELRKLSSFLGVDIPSESLFCANRHSTAYKLGALPDAESGYTIPDSRSLARSRGATDDLILSLKDRFAKGISVLRGRLQDPINEWEHDFPIGETAFNLSKIGGIP